MALQVIMLIDRSYLLNIIQQAVTPACAPEHDVHAERPDLSNTGTIWRHTQRQHHRTAHDLHATKTQQSCGECVGCARPRKEKATPHFAAAQQCKATGIHNCTKLTNIPATLARSIV
jgi:hypothetical protein